MRRLVCFFGVLFGCVLATDTSLHAQATENSLLTWSDKIPPLPDSIGLAGPFVGVHGAWRAHCRTIWWPSHVR